MSNGPTDKDPEHVIRFTRIVKPGEAPEVMNSPLGLMVNDEHGITTYRPDGSVLIHHPDQSIEARKPAVDRIVVSDLRGVAAHKINQLYDTSSHVLEFVNGGTFSCVFDTKRRTLMETRQKGIMTRHTSERLLILQPDMTMQVGDEAGDGAEHGQVTGPALKPGETARLLKSKRAVIVSEENGLVFYDDDGSVMLTRPDGATEISHPCFRRIEIFDLRLVVSHSVESFAEASLHRLTFKGGGTFSCVFGSTGKMLGLNHKRLYTRHMHGMLLLCYTMLEKPEDLAYAG